MNIILQADSYKVSHWKQYPPGTEMVYSYFESRGGLYEKTVFFGLQYILKKYLVGQILTYDKINEARILYKAHFNNDNIFNYEGWAHIMLEHDGRLPLEIKAVAEGTVLETRNVLFTVENTCAHCFWLTSYLETLLEQVWYPTTIATKSYYLKQLLAGALLETGFDAPDFKLHDFGYRGSTSQESAGIGGAAHLLNFKGSDTIAAINLLQQYYQARMPAFSIPAAEHSTITAWGRENEEAAYANILEQFPTGLVAVVSDSYDIYKAVDYLWGGKFKSTIMRRKGTVVIRPDSGDPIEILPELLAGLGMAFGYQTNEKGYKTLPSQVRLIQGDGIDEQSLPRIIGAIIDGGWSLDNIAFGSGGGLLQNVTRDTLKFAYKCSNVTINGKDHVVSKDPITDPGKKSKEGRLVLIQDEATKLFHTSRQSFYADGKLQTVYRNGVLLLEQTLDTIRKRTHEK